MSKNPWEPYLRYSVAIPNEQLEKIAYVPHGTSEPVLKDQVWFWLEENVGYTTASDWHKDPWHPRKPKYLFKSDRFSSRYFNKWICSVKFFVEEDALAFKLTWL